MSEVNQQEILALKQLLQSENSMDIPNNQLRSFYNEKFRGTLSKWEVISPPKQTLPIGRTLVQEKPQGYLKEIRKKIKHSHTPIEKPNQQTIPQSEQPYKDLTSLSITSKTMNLSSNISQSQIKNTSSQKKFYKRPLVSIQLTKPRQNLNTFDKVSVNTSQFDNLLLRLRQSQLQGNQQNVKPQQKEKQQSRSTDQRNQFFIQIPQIPLRTTNRKNHTKERAKGQVIYSQTSRYSEGKREIEYRGVNSLFQNTKSYLDANTSKNQEEEQMDQDQDASKVQIIEKDANLDSVILKQIHSLTKRKEKFEDGLLQARMFNQQTKQFPFIDNKKFSTMIMPQQLKNQLYMLQRTLRSNSPNDNNKNPFEVTFSRSQQVKSPSNKQTPRKENFSIMAKTPQQKNFTKQLKYKYNLQRDQLRKENEYLQKIQHHDNIFTEIRSTRYPSLNVSTSPFMFKIDLKTKHKN